MRGLPLLLSCERPILGPLVPVLRRSHKLIVQGMGQGDQVLVFGHAEGVVKLVACVEQTGEFLLKSLDKFTHLQAERVGQGAPIHVWVE